MGYWELLRTQPAFRRLWLGQVVSELGDWLQMIALIGLFPTRGAAVEMLAGVFIVRMLPAIVWAPLAGVIADRFARGKVMVACDLGRAATVLGYLFVRGPEDAPLIYALMFTQESLASLFEPARAASIPQIVPQAARFAASSLSGATWSAMLALGAALGGTVAASVGARASFLANAASFLVSAALIGSIGIPRATRDAASAEAHPAGRAGLLALREGMAYLRRERAQASAALVKGLWGTSGGIILLFSIYAGEVFTPKGVDPARTTGLLYAGRGVGALIGPLIARRVFGESVASLRRAIQVAFPIAACGIVAFSYAPSAPIAAALLVIVHAGGSTCWVSSTLLLQMTVPNHLQGRVFSVELAAFTFAMAVSNGLTGAALGHALASLQGVTFGIAAAPAISALVWAFAMRRLGPRLDAAGERAKLSSA